MTHDTQVFHSLHVCESDAKDFHCLTDALEPEHHHGEAG